MAKLTKEMLEKKIDKVQYSIVDLDEGPRMTMCFIIIDGGFVVTGQSACMNTEDFNREIGEHYAYEQAFEKLWELEAYFQNQVAAFMDGWAKVK